MSQSKLFDELYHSYQSEGMSAREASIEANKTLKEMRREVLNGVNPQQVLADYGLELDFAMDLY